MGGRNILLVEGTDDKHVVMHLCNHHQLGHIDEIADQGGVDKLLSSFPVRLKESDVNALGVVVDADTDMHSRWQSLRHHLSAAGYPDLPEAPIEQGTVLNPPVKTIYPKVGIWLMPDNTTNGILEDFLRFLVPVPNPLLAHAKTSIEQIPASERRFAAKDDAKALMHTWLAWQEEPGKPFGTAIMARYLDADVQQATQFADWLKRLFF